MIIINFVVNFFETYTIKLAGSRPLKDVEILKLYKRKTRNVFHFLPSYSLKKPLSDVTILKLKIQF